MLTFKEDILIARAGAHAQPGVTLRPDQRFTRGVTSLSVARVMYGLETGVQLYLTPTGRWFVPGHSVAMNRLGFRLTEVVQEMIRTGLLRYWHDRNGHHLVAAKVHLLSDGGVSACHFAGEGVGAMRARLIADPALVDCLDCVSGRDPRL